MTHNNNVLGGKEESPLRRAMDNIPSYPRFGNTSRKRLEEFEVQGGAEPTDTFQMVIDNI